LQLALFNMFTEAVRSGYPITLNLKSTTTANITPSDTTAALNICNIVATLGIFLTPRLVEGSGFLCFKKLGNGPSMRRAGVASFFCLALGHFMLAISASFWPLFAAGTIFGLGEALSCGLRVVAKNNARNDLKAQDVPTVITNAFIIQINSAQQLVAIFNQGCMPIVGNFVGMSAVSRVYGAIALMATLFCLSPMFHDSCADISPPELNDVGGCAGMDSKVVKAVCCPCSALGRRTTDEDTA